MRASISIQHNVDFALQTQKGTFQNILLPGTCYVSIDKLNLITTKCCKLR